MIQNYTAVHDGTIEAEKGNLRFLTETVKLKHISPHAFFKAGAAQHPGECFYWKNASRTLTLVGLGHATVLSNDDADGRFMQISAEWKKLCASLVKEENDMAPVLFGGFAFDPKSAKNSEWDGFPSAYFVVPTFQLIIKDGEASISINLITESDDATEAVEQLRNERDLLIRMAARESTLSVTKPKVASIEERAKEQYMTAVADVTEQIKSGEAAKVVIARSLTMNFEGEVQGVTALHHISNEQPGSYHFGLQKDEQLFFGATPERLIEISAGRAYSACVAGSIRRGKTEKEDDELGMELLADCKNREEHQYVVNMISNVFNRFCSNLAIPNKPELMKVRDIQHLFTPVEGTVARGIDIFSLVEALHPTPALGGVPTDTSMAIIRQAEKMDRGYYAAPIGWTDSEGDGEFAVAIRSALLEGDRAHLYAGGGIVAESEVKKEYEETWVKFRPVLRALGGKIHGE